MTTTTPDESEWMSAGDAARLLGVSIDTLRRYDDGQIPLLQSVRTPGGHRRWRRSDLQTFIRSREAKAQ